MTTPTRKELLELIEDLAEMHPYLIKKYHSIHFYDYGERSKGLAARVNTALADPITEERLLGVDIFPNGKIHLDIYEDILEEYTSQINQEHENGLTAQADEQNDHIGVQ